MTHGICFANPARWLRGEHLFWPAAQWQALQRQELAGHLARARTSRFYSGRIRRHEADIATLPITTKDDLSAAGGDAFACEPAQIREWVTTSGTSGKPLGIPLTAGDLDRLAANEHAAFSLAGLGPTDVLLMLVGMDRLFVAGLAYWLGAQSIGAAVVRAGPQHASSAALLSETIRRYGATHIIAVPSFLAAHACDKIDAPSLRAIIAIGEPIRSVANPLEFNAVGARLAGTFGVPILSTYASTETCATFAEGPNCAGGHLNPQMAIVEILDDAGQALPPGAPGEVTVTPLGVEGIPLIRFRTGDIAAIDDSACRCGRTTPRLGPIVGRKQQLMKVKGASIYPNAIAEALATVPEVLDTLTIVEHGGDRNDVLTLHVALSADAAPIRQRVESALRAMLKVLPRVAYTNSAALRELQFSDGSRKPRRFIDRRNGGTSA